jgi:hypothetical protein
VISCVEAIHAFKPLSQRKLSELQNTKPLVAGLYSVICLDGKSCKYLHEYWKEADLSHVISVQGVAEKNNVILLLLFDPITGLEGHSSEPQIITLE